MIDSMEMLSYNGEMPAAINGLALLTINESDFGMADDIILPPDSKAIPLTQGKHAIVDAEDYEYLMQWKWCARKGKAGNYYALKGIKTGINKRGTIFLHRKILKIPNGKIIDHINGNGLDNRRCNLRICSNAENSFNSKKTVLGTSSIYKGVTWREKGQKWIAQVTINYKNIYLGIFHSEEEAALAYNKAAIKYYGEFSNLNIIQNKEGK